MKFPLLFAQISMCLGSQGVGYPEVRTFVRFEGEWHSEAQGNVKWRLGEMLYVASDGYWLRLNGTISQYASTGSTLLFSYREGHSQDIGTWFYEKDKVTIKATGRRLGMGNPEIVVGTLEEKWTRSRDRASRETMEVGTTGRKVTFEILLGQTPDRRVAAAIDEERRRKKPQLTGRERADVSETRTGQFRRAAMSAMPGRIISPETVGLRHPREMIRVCSRRVTRQLLRYR